VFRRIHSRAAADVVRLRAATGGDADATSGAGAAEAMRIITPIPPVPPPADVGTGVTLPPDGLASEALASKKQPS
jgi:hypothetical protein